MVVLKTTTGGAHLETIYEEPSNWNGSGNPVPPPVIQQTHTDAIVTGLISARSLPPVNAQRQQQQQQPVESQAKPPIEVRFRDGSKRFIHSDNENAAAGAEASSSDAAQANATAAYYQNQQPNFGQQRVQRRPPIVITIISAKDLRQIDVVSTDMSSPEPATPSPMIHSTPRLSHTFTSPAASSTISTPFQPVPSLEQTVLNQQSILAHSQSTSTVGTLRSKKSACKVSFAPLPHTAYIQASMGAAVDQAGANTRSPSASSQLSQDLSLTINSSQRSNASESQSLHSKQSTPSLQHSLSDESEHRHTSSSGTPASNYTAEQANMAVSIGGGAHSAFRPFLRQMRLNHKSFPINKRMPFTVNMRALRPSQRQQMLSYVQYYNQHRQQQQPRQPWGNHQQQNPTTILTNFTQLPVYAMPGQNENLTVSNPHSALALPNTLDIRTGPGQSLSVPVSPSVPWHNITSNSIYEIPRLAKRFDSIPLRITLPVVSPHFNQKALVHHNTALERRLLNAGLSPETVALYERVLDIGKTLPASPQQLSDRP